MLLESYEPSDKSNAAEELLVALRDGINLIHTEVKSNERPSDLKVVLATRLARYYGSRGQDWSPENLKSLRDAETLTAEEALAVVERIQVLLSIEDDAIVPAIGTRDLSQIRTMLSLIFKWGTDSLLKKVRNIWPGPLTVSSPSSRIMDLSTLSEDYSRLSNFTKRVLGLILPDGVYGKLPRSLITTTLLSRHLVDVLRPALSLGWLPKSLGTEQMPVQDAFRPLVMRLLSILPTSQTIESLGSILSDPSQLPVHVNRTCSSLLSQQILRPDGVQGLFRAIFGEEETSGGDIAIEKLEHVSTVLNAVPSNTKPHDYFIHVIPRIIALLSEKSPPAYRRAASFTISRMLRQGSNPDSHALKSAIISDLLHDPFRRVSGQHNGVELEQLERLPPNSPAHLRPDVAVDALLTLLSNADPSPSFIAELLSPIVPALYSLLYHLGRVKTSDPKLRESIHGILLTWGKIISPEEGLASFWLILNEKPERNWKIELEGHIKLLPEREQESSLSFLTPDRVPGFVDVEDPDFDANLFDLYPDPLHFVKIIKDMGRADIASALFVKLLEAYRREKSRSASDNLQILLNLQVIMQMQKQLSEGTTSNILGKPQQMLSFIHHVLSSAISTPAKSTQLGQSELEERLRIVSLQSDSQESPEYEGDSDDDVPDSETIQPDDELVETAINLLLSIMEADEDLSARTMPILNDLFSLLEPLSKDGSTTIRPLAREARLVMTARLASTSQHRHNKRRSDQAESAQEIYQKALKLLQDPILPVRAHGLLLLRQLITPSIKQGSQVIDPALTPAILSIFLQSVQDEDSYIFLNSVQGLAAMVDGLGKEVLKGLIQEYSGKLQGLGSSVVTQQEIDVRTRIGEALGIIIRRCGETLGIYADLLIPPLFRLIRTIDVPTTLKTSALSLLAECVNTCSLAVLPYNEDLTSAMIDLLQTESTQSHPPVQIIEPTDDDSRADPKSGGGRRERVQETMDTSPTSKNTKFPPLRRAALHFLGLLAKAATEHTYATSTSRAALPSQSMIQRAMVTLDYLSGTDEDEIVRVMAREVREGLVELQKAKLGI